MKNDLLSDKSRSIGCDFCESWYHDECLGLKKVSDKLKSDYYPDLLPLICEKCKDRKRRNEEAIDIVKKALEEFAINTLQWTSYKEDIGATEIPISRILDMAKVKLSLTEKVNKMEDVAKECANLAKSFDDMKVQMTSMVTSLSDDVKSMKNDVTSPSQGRSTSYADKLKNVKEKHLLVINSSNNIDQEQRKEILHATGGVQIVNTKFNGKSMTMNFSSKADKEKVENSLRGNLTNINVESVKKWKPRIMIKDVPIEAYQTDGALIASLIEKNDYLKGNETDMKVISCRPGRSGKRGDYVIQCEPNVRAKMKSKGDKVSLYWEIRDVVDYLRPTICYKCQGYRHTAKSCRHSQEVCKKCAGPHKSKECTSTEIKCVNCMKKSLPHDHLAHSAQCASMIAEERTVIERTSHGL
ncbi:MAG: hypothetical protein AAGM46_26880 [Cyanobacteria bacterium J06582_2]